MDEAIAVAATAEGRPSTASAPDLAQLNEALRMRLYEQTPARRYLHTAARTEPQTLSPAGWADSPNAAPTLTAVCHATPPHDTMNSRQRIIWARRTTPPSQTPTQRSPRQRDPSPGGASRQPRPCRVSRLTTSSPRRSAPADSTDTRLESPAKQLNPLQNPTPRRQRHRSHNDRPPRPAFPPLELVLCTCHATRHMPGPSTPSSGQHQEPTSPSTHPSGALDGPPSSDHAGGVPEPIARPTADGVAWGGTLQQLSPT